jgi:hypothetical protein
MTAEPLPVPVLESPRWRLNFRPSKYEEARILSVTECLEIVEKNRVRLRGWDFPHISKHRDGVHFGQNWVASWSDAWNHLEYWRLYQSSQFVYLGSVREVTEKAWNARIRDDMKWHADDDVDIDAVPGFVSFTEVVYTTTEYFEFAARLAQAEIYSEALSIKVSLIGIRDFMLAADKNRGWSSDYTSRTDQIDYEVTLNPADVVASASEQALKTTVWIFERFGWTKPNLEAIKAEQQKLLTGRF